MQLIACPSPKNCIARPIAHRQHFLVSGGLWRPCCIGRICIFARKRIAYDSVKNLFTQPCLQIHVELFLKKIINF
jgi:hypothetical protein